jgi:hypothetical protein
MANRTIKDKWDDQNISVEQPEWFKFIDFIEMEPKRDAPDFAIEKLAQFKKKLRI